MRFARWLPPAGRKGTVVILQGRGEWIEKYFETVRDLRARGFAVAALDWRGQGLSERMLGDRHKGYVRDFAEYDSDLETFMREIVLPDCPPPLFALGHSTGATVLIRAAYRGRRWFDRMVLAAPLIDLQGFAGDDDGESSGARAAHRRLRQHVCAEGRRRRHGGKALRRQYSHLRSGALCAQPGDPRSRARAGARPRRPWPGPTRRSAPCATMRERSYPAHIRQPILIIAAGSDAVVSNAAIEDFATHLRAGSHLVVVGAQHELLMEQDRYRAQFWAAFDAFVPGTALY